MVGADAFAGVARPGLVTAEMVKTMNQGIVFAMANPTPEIMPEEYSFREYNQKITRKTSLMEIPCFENMDFLKDVFLL